MHLLAYKRLLLSYRLIPELGVIYIAFYARPLSNYHTHTLMSYNTQALERGREFFNRIKTQMKPQSADSDETESAQLQDSLVKYYVTRNKPLPEWLEEQETRESLERLKLNIGPSSMDTHVTATRALAIDSSVSVVPELTHGGRSPSPHSPQTPTTPPSFSRRPSLKSSPSHMQDIYAKRGSSVDVSRQNSVVGLEKYGRSNYGYEGRTVKVPPPLNKEQTDRMREKLRNVSRSNSVRCH